MSSRFIHAGAHGNDLIKTKEFSIVCSWYNLVTSSVPGHVGCFYIFVGVGSVTMNMNMLIPFYIQILSFFWDKDPEVGFPDHMASLVLIFGKAALLYSIVAALLRNRTV